MFKILGHLSYSKVAASVDGSLIRNNLMIYAISVDSDQAEHFHSLISLH